MFMAIRASFAVHSSTTEDTEKTPSLLVSVSSVSPVVMNLFHVLADNRLEFFLRFLRHVLRSRDDGGRERVLARAAARLVKPRYGLGDRFLRSRSVLHQVGDDEIHRDRIVIGVPAVVVGDQCERGITE